MTKSLDIAIFNHSDGLTPIQTKKLNQNFQRLIDVISGRDENSEAAARLATIVREALYPDFMDNAYPIGTILFAKDPSALPKVGKWQELIDYKNRFIRIGDDYGTTGGSNSQTINFALPRHRHGFLDGNNHVNQSVQVEKYIPGSGNSVTVYNTFRHSEDSKMTDYAGEDNQTQTISTIPPYVTLRLFERYE